MLEQPIGLSHVLNYGYACIVLIGHILLVFGHRKVRTDQDKETRVVQANVQNDGRCGPEPMCPGVLGDPVAPAPSTHVVQASTSSGS